MNRDLYKEIDRDWEIINDKPYHLKTKTPQKYSDIMRRQQSNQKSPQKRTHQFAVITNKYDERSYNPPSEYVRQTSENIHYPGAKYQPSPQKQSLTKMPMNGGTRASTNTSPIKMSMDYSRSSPKKTSNGSSRVTDSNTKRRQSNADNAYQQK